MDEILNEKEKVTLIAQIAGTLVANNTTAEFAVKMATRVVEGAIEAVESERTASLR
jgi:hypothetical protein